MLRALHLTGMADHFADLASKAATAHLPYETYLTEVVRCECILREQRRIARLLRQSRLPAEKTFHTLQLDRFPLGVQQQVAHLRRGAFLGDAVNIVAVGKPGVGKSHLLAALGQELILQGQAVWWTSTASLVQLLLAAKRDLRLPQELKRLDRFACLILDGCPLGDRLRPARPRRDGGAVYAAGRTLRAAQRRPLHQPRLLRVGAHLQRSDDHAGRD
jgi:DNA replication protein DnaC